MTTVESEQEWAQGSAPPSTPEQATPPSLPGAMGEAIIGQDLEIDGEFRSQGKLVLSGTIRGEVHCASLVVTEEGQITGKIVAEEVVIHGAVEGMIYGVSVDLFASANVNGDIFHSGVGVERGTRYDGTLKYLDDPISAGRKAARK